MIKGQIENLNIISEDVVASPNQLKQLFPATDKAIKTVLDNRQTIRDILDRKDHRLLVIVGPCSIHDIESAKEYGLRLKELSKKVNETLFIVMRVYFEKPRTNIGWQGFINDPFLDKSYQVDRGLKLARQLLLHFAENGLPTAGEALDLITPQYIQDLISWIAIGARTSESQLHRKMASGSSCPVGFKNSTNGDVTIAVNALIAAARENYYFNINSFGQVILVRTKGNPYSHIILRGGNNKGNYYSQDIQYCEELLLSANLLPNIMIDCSHDNSKKVPQNQINVIESISDTIIKGNQSIVGLMIESNLNWGNQSISNNPSDLKYGVSITDACIDWKTTEEILLKLGKELKTIQMDRKII